MERIERVVFSSRPFQLSLQLPQSSGEESARAVRLALEALMPGVDVADKESSGSTRWLTLRSGQYRGSASWRELEVSTLNSRLEDACFVSDISQAAPNQVILTLNYAATPSHLTRLAAYLKKEMPEVRSATPGARVNRKPTLQLAVSHLDPSEFVPKLRKCMRFLI